jgi:poly(hydroxyalkanoate) depolymerase family esterase
MTMNFLPIRRHRTALFCLLGAALGVLTASPAHAASLQPVTGWTGGVTLPADVSMYIYVPNAVATNPPILTLVHYCGGSAQAVFNQAQGGGLVSAADKYGFILVVPSNANASGANGRCWDISSKATQTRDGGGDSHAVVQMVRYTISQYHANANRVYSTGDSSGAMMTQLLLALYPDIYKAGSSFAGVPAGCSNAFDAQGLCGLPAQTAQQWGDRVRAMDPGYSGYRPRVQLFHGDADATINYKNFGEAIKEWTDVLGLSANPTSTTTGLTLGTHQATRQTWKNACGYAVLDGFTSIGGDHGPSDALFVAQYVVPFLGLDQTGAVDPEIAQCGGDGGGGQPADAGMEAGGAGGVDGGGPSRDAGGNSGSSGGSASTGSSSGGSSGGSGGSGSGGGVGSSGASGGGSSGNGGGSGSSSGSTPSTDADASDNPAAGGPRSNGCSCGIVGIHSRMSGGLAAGALGLAVAAFRRRRRSPA